MSDRTTLFELKEKAKWSADPQEKKAAIKELSTHGQAAVPQLEEILTITAYEEIRTACAEAIKAILADVAKDLKGFMRRLTKRWRSTARCLMRTLTR